MSNLFGYFSVPVQLGFDIATSLTIIGSLMFFLYTMRNNIKNEKAERFDKQARAVAAEQLKSSNSALSDIYINEVILHSEKLKRTIRLSKESNFEREMRALSSPEKLDAALVALNNAQNAVGDFYEKLHVEKFNIIPVIDSIEDNSLLVEQFIEQLDRIADSYNKQSGFTVALINELKTLKEAMNQICKSNGIENKESFISLLSEKEEVFNLLRKYTMSIVLDVDYYDWTKSFVDEEDRALFKSALTALDNDEKLTEEMSNIISETFQQLLFGTYDSSTKYYAQIFFIATNNQKEANKSCKSVLATLSAILKYLLQKGGKDKNLNAILEQYKGENYFDIETKIR
ncbi:hypothetical protein [Rheinheimera sp. WS51]|uniref:hypothetical protein n=1 Tax=Rheinheimera sp. WS51 TaxID=3425886 RepID=UPI003D93E268